MREYFPDPSFTLTVRREAAQVPLRRHGHEFEELVVIAAGTGWHQGPGGSWRLQPGDVFAVPRGATHGFTRTRNLELWNVLFRPETLPVDRTWLERQPGYLALFTLEPRARAADGGAGRLRLATTETAMTLSLLRQLRAVLDQPGPGSAATAIGLFLQLIGGLCEAFVRRPPRARRRLIGLERALERLTRLDETPPTLGQLAADAGMSVSTFQRAWRRHTPESPGCWRRNLQLTRACDLLRTSDLSITEIARQVGYDDSNHFSRQFRARLGSSPRAWRADHRPAPGGATRTVRSVTAAAGIASGNFRASAR